MAQPRQTTPLTPSWSFVAKDLELLRQRIEQVTVIVILPTLVIDLGGLLMSSNSLIGWLVLLVGIAWWLVNIGASYYLQVSAAKGKIVSTADCYRKSWRSIGRIIGFTLIFSIMAFVGFLLLIVPGLIILRRYILTTYYIVDQDLPIRQAMERSALETKPVSGYVWGTIGVIVALLLAITLISSLLISIPGATIIVSALLSPAYFFILPLRYADITAHAPASAT